MNRSSKIEFSHFNFALITLKGLLISRNFHELNSTGMLEEFRDGKTLSLIFYIICTSLKHLYCQTCEKKPPKKVQSQVFIDR